MRRKLHRALQKALITKLHRFSLGGTCAGKLLLRQRIEARIQRPGHNGVAVIEHNFAVGNPADLRSDRLVNFVANDKETKQMVFSGRTRVNRLQEDLI